MGQGPRALLYIEPQIKVIRAMGPKGPSALPAVAYLQRRDGFRLQERSDRPQGWPSSRMHKSSRCQNAAAGSEPASIRQRAMRAISTERRSRNPSLRATGTTTSVPARHRQLIVVALRHQHLMDIDVPDVECRRAPGEVEVPHAHELLILPARDRFVDLEEIVVPAHQCPIVVAPQALHVEHAEVRIVGVRDQLAQRRQRAAREPGKMYLRIHGSDTTSSWPVIVCRRKMPPSFSRWFAVSMYVA